MTEDEHEETIARMRQQADQAGVAHREIARTLASFRNELLEQGFSPTETLALVVTQLQILMGQAFNGEAE